MQDFALTFISTTKLLETLHRGLNLDLSGVYTDHTSQPQGWENCFPPECNHVLTATKILDLETNRGSLNEPHVQVRVCVRVCVRFGCVDDGERAKVQDDKRPQIKTECKFELIGDQWSRSLSNFQTVPDLVQMNWFSFTSHQSVGDLQQRVWPMRLESCLKKCWRLTIWSGDLPCEEQGCWLPKNAFLLAGLPDIYPF